MKSFKCLLALPVAIVALAACGNGEANFKEADLAAAKEIAETYATTISNSKASNIIVSGRVNKFALDGDMTYWHYTENEVYESRSDVVGFAAQRGQAVQKSGILGLLMMVPNFSVKDSHVYVDPHDIATFTMPGSLVSLGETLLSELSNMERAAAVTLVNLPKFPMNPRLLRTIGGLDKVPEDIPTEEEWDAAKDKPWTKATVSYFTSGSRLKVTVSTDDLEAFFKEVDERYFGEEPIGGRTSEKKFPASFTITTNEIGYIDSLSVNFKAEGIDEKEESEALYLSVKGNLEVDIALNFKQTISDPITIKYQLSVYHQADVEEGEVPDAEYIINDGKAKRSSLSKTNTNIPLKYDKDKSIPATTDLSKFSDYLTFEWFSNTELLNPDVDTDDTRVITKVYDDPLFCYNYWKNDLNVAFTNESYDVLAIPKYKIVTDESGEKEVKYDYQVLGGVFHNYANSAGVHSMVTTSVDGRVISTDGGLYSDAAKVLNTAGDAVHNSLLPKMSGGEDYQPIVIKGENDSDIILPIDEIFINSNSLSAKDSNYIIDIPVVKLLEKK